MGKPMKTCYYRLYSSLVGREKRVVEGGKAPSLMAIITIKKDVWF